MTTGQVGIAGSASTITSSVPFGTTGNSTLAETSSGGLLAASILPLGTNTTAGAIKGDGTTIDCATVAGTCASAQGTTNATTSSSGTGASPSIAQFDAGWYKNLNAASLTATFPVSTSLSATGGVLVAGINAGTIAATSPDTITSAAGTGASTVAVEAGCNATVTTDGAGHLYVSGNLCTATGAAFNALTSGTNTTAAMVVGTGASLSLAGATLPTPGAGVLGIAGEATKPTLAANGEGAVWLDSTTGGLGLIGKGSSNDFTLYNAAGTSTCAVATGTTNFACVALQGGAGTGFNLNLATATLSGSLPVANRSNARADVGASTGNVFTAPSGYFICTAACTVTPPVPVVGYQFCVWDLPGTTGAITLANPGTGVMYGKVDFSGYGTATSGTLVSTGAAGDKACIVGKDATHYDTPSSHGSWTAS
jgi:hypothetical protein